MSKVYIGIDPGLTGAVSVIKRSGKVKIFDTPIEEIKKGKSIKREYLPENMADILIKIINLYGNKNCNVFIEKVHSMPGQGVASMFNFGKGYGIWIGILAALKISKTLVTPQEWKKEMMSGMKDKDAARIRAQELFPECSIRLQLKKHIDRADSLLIAEYARRKGF